MESSSFWSVLVISITAAAAIAMRAAKSVRATHNDKIGTMPGDELITMPIASLTHAITIDRSPQDVWPWLAQMGADRGGWYSYDTVDNGGRRSAERILPEFQTIAEGTLFPAVPGATDGFFVLREYPPHVLVLGVRSSNGAQLVTWAFELRESGRSRTRLVVRARGGPGYRFRGLPMWMITRIVPIVHFVMQRKQLLGIARRAENHRRLVDMVRLNPRTELVERT